MQPPRRHVIEQRDQHVHGGVFGMGPGRHVVERRDELHVSRAPQRDRALSVLGRLDGVGRAQRARRFGDLSEVLLREPERGRFLELARQQQHRVVRLVVVAVERPQPLDRHILDIRACPDDRLSVVVPQVGARRHAFAQHAEGAVFPRLELVAHDRHFRVQVAPGDGGVDHAVGFDIEHVVESLPVRRERFEVIGPVERGAAVVARSALLEIRLDARETRRAAEHEVLQKMRHSGLAVAFLPRADEVGDVDRDGIDRAVGDQKDFQAVRQAIFGDPFDRGDPRDPGGQARAGRLGQGGRGRKDEGERGEEGDSKGFHRACFLTGGGRASSILACAREAAART